MSAPRSSAHRLTLHRGHPGQAGSGLHRVSMPPGSAAARAWWLPWRGAVGPRPSMLCMPFDAMRHHYASAVSAGLIRRSLIASGQLERTLDALEKLILGPLARQR